MLVNIARYPLQVSVDMDPYFGAGSHLSDKVRFLLPQYSG